MSSDSAKPYHIKQQEERDARSILIVLVILLIILCYYAIFTPLLRRINHASTSRNRAQRRLLDESNADDPSLQLQSHGLEFSAAHSLPMHQFKKNEEEHEPINTDCAICLGEFEEGKWLKHLPNCSHGFHVSCIDAWFQSHSSCPLCRACVDHDLPASLECHVSSYTLLENLMRENFFQERDAHLQPIHSEKMAIRSQ